MAQVILTDFQLKIDDYLKELERLKSQIRSVVNEREKDRNAEEKNVNELKNAVEKRRRLLEQELSTLQKLQAAKAKAYTVKDIEEYNRKISETQKNIKLLKGESDSLNGIAGKLKASFMSLGAGIAAAFSVQAISAFAKQSVDSFIEAQKSAELLRFSIISIGNESEAQFNRLLNQSSKLQQTTIFSDEQIQQAQSALSAFGLTANQIEKMIPKLTDLATVLGTDVVSAAHQVGTGLQGTGREFKRLGIDVSQSKTEIENYNTILSGLERISGAAAEAAKTLSGELERQKNRADELQEKIGSQLAPAYVKLKIAVFEFIAGLFSSEQTFNRSRGIYEEQADVLQELGFTLDKHTKSVKENGGSQREAIKTYKASADAIYSAKLQMDTFVKSINEGTSKIKDLIDFNKSYREQLKQSNISEAARMTILKLMADTEEQLKEAIKERAEQESRIVKSEKLKALSTSQLNTLLDENKKKQDIISQSNVKQIERELEIRKKLQEEVEKQNAKKKQSLLQLEKEIDSILNRISGKSLTKEQKIKLQFETDISSLNKAAEDTRTIAEIEKEIERKKAEAKIAINKNYQDELAQLLSEELSNVEKTLDEELKLRIKISEDTNELNNQRRLEGLKEGSTEYLKVTKEILKEELDLKIRNISATVSNDKDAFNQIELAKIEFKKKIQDIDRQIAENGINETKRWADNFINTFNFVAQEVQSLLSAFTQNQIKDSNIRIEKLNEEGAANKAALDKEAEELRRQRDEKYISEKQYQERLKKLEEQKLANEKKIAAEINKEKRKQAEIERALRLFEIAINIPSAVTKIMSQLGIAAPPAIAIAIALGALQSAAVLSAPLPAFAKGTKGKKDSGLALVGEKGAEIVNMPKGSQVLHNKGFKKHKEVINAMMDDRFDEYVYSKFVLPEVLKIRKTYNEKKQVSNDITNITAGIDEYAMRRVAKDGFRIANAEEIAMMIANNLNTDIRRRI